MLTSIKNRYQVLYFISSRVVSLLTCLLSYSCCLIYPGQELPGYLGRSKVLQGFPSAFSNVLNSQHRLLTFLRTYSLSESPFFSPKSCVSLLCCQYWRSLSCCTWGYKWVRWCFCSVHFCPLCGALSQRTQLSTPLAYRLGSGFYM